MARVWGNRTSHTLLEGEQYGATATEGNLTRFTKMTQAVPSGPASLTSRNFTLGMSSDLCHKGFLLQPL